MRASSIVVVVSACVAVVSVGLGNQPPPFATAKEGESGPPPQPTPTDSAPQGVTGTFEGSVTENVRGKYQVQVTFTNGTVTEVHVIQAGTRDHDSREINRYAVPRLEQQIIDAQSWDVAFISGASYTSEGVRRSAKYAFAAAGLP